MSAIAIRRRRNLGFAAPLLALAAIVISGGPIHADCANPPAVARPVDARGTTFVGTVLEYRNRPGDKDSQITWRVEKVYNGAPLPAVLSFGSPPCVTTLVREGDRYLFSTANISRPSQEDSLAWAVSDGGAVTLWPFNGEPREYPRSTRALDTLVEALDAVAPYWNTPLPPTDSASPSGQVTAGTVMAAILVVSTALSLTALRRRKPSNSD